MPKRPKNWPSREVRNRLMQDQDDAKAQVEQAKADILKAARDIHEWEHDPEAREPAVLKLISAVDDLKVGEEALREANAAFNKVAFGKGA